MGPRRSTHRQVPEHGAIFAPDGSYLGEIATNNRLRVARADRLFQIDPFPRMDNRARRTPLMDRMPYTLIGGYEDFPT